jgi:hypothetical protein
VSEPGLWAPGIGYGFRIFLRFCVDFANFAVKDFWPESF